MTDFWQSREGFWNRDGWWKALLVTVAYLAVFLGISEMIGLTLASTGNYAVIIFGIVALFLIRGRVNKTETAAPATTANPTLQ